MNQFDCIYCGGELIHVMTPNSFLIQTIEKYAPGLEPFQCMDCERKFLFSDGNRDKIRGIIREWKINQFKYGQEIFISGGELIVWEDIVE